MQSTPDPPESAEIITFCRRQICLRQLRANDRPLLEHLVALTDLHDLRMRFLGGFHALPPNLLDHLTRIDPEQRITLVATSTTSGGNEEILAVGRAHALAENNAELGLLVRSDLKGMGLGSLLLERLIARCRSRGIAHLEADVFRENIRMLCLADRYGFLRKSQQFDTTHLVLDLDPLAA
jgi:GNAT superfamily N-acetyltransferase